jgi:hypothetical protein
MQWTRDTQINNSVTQPVSEQRLGKYVLAATNTHATIEERSFLCGPCREVITGTVRAMKSRRKRRKGNPVPGGIAGTTPTCGI